MIQYFTSLTISSLDGCRIKKCTYLSNMMPTLVVYIDIEVIVIKLLLVNPIIVLSSIVYLVIGLFNNKSHVSQLRHKTLQR